MPPPDELRSLRILHLALLGGCGLFLAVAGLIGPLDQVDEDLAGALHVVGAAVLGLLPVAFVLFRIQLRKGPFDLAQADGFERMRALLITHWALIEAPCMLNLVLLMCTGAMLHAALAITCLVVLALRAPTPSRLAGWAAGLH
jgi:hypothetical protein